MVKKLYLKPIMTDEEITQKEGHYFPESHYQHIIKEDSDVYTDEPEPQLLIKFRKNVFSTKMCCDAYHALVKHAQKKNYNRGAASGTLNINKLPKYARTMKKGERQKFRIYYKDKKGRTKKDHISNMALSNIAGYYDQPDRNLLGKMKNPPKCRTTQFTANQVTKWNQALPLLQAASQQFAKLVPDRFRIQLKRARLTPEFQIDKTAFSTITLNYNWRTACHQDKGDLEEGFGNLIVLERDQCDSDGDSYQGGYLGFPRYGVAVDVRQGDFLAMNVHEWHCNTEITPKDSSKKNYGRLSIVCYLRKNMIQCQKK